MASLTTVSILAASAAEQDTKGRGTEGSQDDATAAQFRLAIALIEGKGGHQKDPSKGIQLLQSAIDRGSIDAESHLGVLYLLGNPIEKNVTKGETMLRSAASKGCRMAHNYLFFAWMQDLIVEKDLSKAVVWVRVAAENNLADAQNKYGLMYFNGEGVSRNREEAVKWFKKADGSGSAIGAYNLAFAHYHGMGVPKDIRVAYESAIRSVTRGHTPAVKLAGLLLFKGEGGVRDEKKGLDYIATALGKSSLLDWAATEGHWDIIRYKLGNADFHRILTEPYPKSVSSLTALAAAKAEWPLVESLVQMGSNVDGEDEKQMTALHFGAKSGNANDCAMLVRNGANLGKPKKTSWMSPADPLRLAVRSGSIPTCEILIKGGAIIEAAHFGAATSLRDDEKSTRYTDDFKHPRGELTRFLFRSISDKSIAVAKALEGAEMWSDPDFFILLLQNGANPNWRKGNLKDENDLINTAALMHLHKIIDELVVRGADVNSRNKDGGTPLHHAVFVFTSDKNEQAAALKTVQILLKHDARLDIKNKDGYTPLRYAKRGAGIGSTDEIIGLLERHGR